MSEPPHKEDDAAFAADADKIRGGLDARIQAIKLTLMEWAAEQTRPGIGGAITLAMLELGIERHLNLFSDEQSAADLNPVQFGTCSFLAWLRGLRLYMGNFPNARFLEDRCYVSM